MAISQGPFYKEVGGRIRRARVAAKLSQGKLGDFAGLSRSSVANIESGRQPVYLHALVRIADQLRTPISKLIPIYHSDPETKTSPELEQLPDDERRFVTLIFKKQQRNDQEENVSAIRVGKKRSTQIAPSRGR